MYKRGFRRKIPYHFGRFRWNRKAKCTLWCSSSDPLRPAADTEDSADTPIDIPERRFPTNQILLNHKKKSNRKRRIYIFRQCYVGILFEGVVACGTITETLSDQHNDQLDVQHPSDVHDQLFGNIQLLVRCLFPLHGTINNSISTLSKDPYRAGSAMYWHLSPINIIINKIDENNQ